MQPLAQPAVPGQVLSYIDNATSHIKEYSLEAGDIYTTLGLNVNRFCFSLPWPAAVITYRLWKAAPYIAAQIFLPSSLYIMGVVAVIAYQVIVTSREKKPNLTSLLNGIGFSQIISGTRSLLIGNPSYLGIQVITGIFWITIGTACLYYSGIVKRICNPPKPQDIQQDRQN